MYIVDIMYEICIFTTSFKGLYALGVRAKYYHCDRIWVHNCKCNTQNFFLSGGGGGGPAPLSCIFLLFVLKIILKK